MTFNGEMALFCLILPNLVVSGVHCVKVVDKAITTDNLRLLTDLRSVGGRSRSGTEVLSLSKGVHYDAELILDSLGHIEPMQLSVQQPRQASVVLLRTTYDTGSTALSTRSL